MKTNRLAFLFFIFPGILFSQPDSSSANGKASYYHDKFQGRETSNGEEYDQHDFTAAHRTLPFNTIVYVKNKKNNRSAVVRINDRGPFKKSRIIDLTRSAAKKLDMIPFGVVPVKIQALTYLDQFPISDSLLKDNDVWDCHIQKVVLKDTTIFIWQTKNLKHALYMASDILLSYHLQNTFVKASDAGQSRRYLILIPLPDSKNYRNELLGTLKKDGFLYAKLYPD